MDQEKIERALDACYEAVAAPDTWQPALDAMSAAMGAAAIMFYPKDLGADTAPMPCSRAYEEFLPDFMAGGWYDGHYRSERGWPLLSRMRECVVIEHDLATDEERRKLPHYNELYLPKGYPGFAAVGFEARGSHWAMCILRDAKQGFFTPEDAARLLPLAGHFRRMVRLAEGFEASCVSASLSALDLHGRAAAALAKDGRVMAVNAACETLLRRSADGLVVRNGRLAAVEPDSNRGLQALVHALVAANHGTRRQVHARTVAVARPGRFPLLAEGLSTAVLGLDQSLHAQAVIVFADPEAEKVSAASRLAVAFGFTPAEAAFAEMVSSGKALEEMSAAQGITREPRATG